MIRYSVSLTQWVHLPILGQLYTMLQSSLIKGFEEWKQANEQEKTKIQMNLCS